MLNYDKTYFLQFLTKIDHEINIQVSFGNIKIATTQILRFLGLTIKTSLTRKYHTGERTSRLNNPCYATRSIKPFYVPRCTKKYIFFIWSLNCMLWNHILGEFTSQ